LRSSDGSAPIDPPAGGVPGPPNPATVARLDVSDAWKERFRLIEKAGGARRPKFKELALSERRKIGFNILAFLFGPFYYLAKGMWRKALVLTALALVVFLLLSLLLKMGGLDRVGQSFSLGVGFFYGFRANVDYYKKKVLGDDGWW
jgi:hypothetical protein